MKVNCIYPLCVHEASSGIDTNEDENIFFSDPHCSSTPTRIFKIQIVNEKVWTVETWIPALGFSPRVHSCRSLLAHTKTTLLLDPRLLRSLSIPTYICSSIRTRYSLLFGMFHLRSFSRTPLTNTSFPYKASRMIDHPDFKFNMYCCFRLQSTTLSHSCSRQIDPSRMFSKSSSTDTKGFKGSLYPSRSNPLE